MNKETVIDNLNNFSPKQDEWDELDSLIEEASEHSGDKVVKSLLSLFERFPTHDGYGVFWSIIHTLEAIGGYENELVNSIARQPHELSVLMLNRLINGGYKEIEGKPIINVLKEIANNESLSNEIREEANGFVEYQANRI